MNFAAVHSLTKNNYVSTAVKRNPEFLLQTHHNTKNIYKTIFVSLLIKKADQSC